MSEARQGCMQVLGRACCACVFQSRLSSFFSALTSISVPKQDLVTSPSICREILQYYIVAPIPTDHIWHLKFTHIWHKCGIIKRVNNFNLLQYYNISEKYIHQGQIVFHTIIM